MRNATTFTLFALLAHGGFASNAHAQPAGGATLALAALTAPSVGLRYDEESVARYPLQVQYEGTASTFRPQGAATPAWTSSLTHTAASSVSDLSRRTALDFVTAVMPNGQVFITGIAEGDRRRALAVQRAAFGDGFAGACFAGQTVRVGAQCAGPLRLFNGRDVTVTFTVTAIDADGVTATARTENDTTCHPGFPCHEVRSVTVRLWARDPRVHSEVHEIDYRSGCQPATTPPSECAVHEQYTVRVRPLGASPLDEAPGAVEPLTLCGRTIARGTQAIPLNGSRSPSDAELAPAHTGTPLTEDGPLVSIDDDGLVSVGRLGEILAQEVGPVQGRATPAALAAGFQRATAAGTGLHHLYFHAGTDTTIGQARALLGRLLRDHEVRWLVRVTAPDERAALASADPRAVAAIEAARAAHPGTLDAAARAAISALAGQCASLTRAMAPTAAPAPPPVTGAVLSDALRGLGECACAVVDQGLVLDIARAASGAVMQPEQWQPLPTGPAGRRLGDAAR